MNTNRFSISTLALWAIRVSVAAMVLFMAPSDAGAQATIVDIATDATDPSNLADSEPSIAVNPADPNQIAVVTFSENWGAGVSAPVWKSDDGGTTWRKVTQIPQPPAAAAGVFLGPGDQKISFDAAGNLLIAELGVVRDAFGNVILVQDFIYRQTGAADAALTPGVSFGDDQPHLDVDATAASPCLDQLYAPWLNFNVANERSMASNSNNDGVAMNDVAVGNNATFPNRTTRIAVGPGGQVYVIYKTREGTAGAAAKFENAHFRVSRSDDCGVTWDRNGAGGVSVHGAGTVQTWFTTSFGNVAKGKVARARSSDAWIAVDPGDGDVYAAFVQRDASGFGQIYVARSTDLGVTWMTSRVTDGTHHSGYPEIAVANNGTVGVLYIDFDDSGTNTIFRHRFARSFNDGGSWSTQNLQSMDPAPIANAVSGRMWLDYEALTASGNMFYGVFTGQSIGRTTLQLDPIFFRETAVQLGIVICVTRPWLCRDPEVVLGPERIILECLLRGCVKIDPIPRNCLVKFDCPGCPPNVQCYYNFFIEGLDEAWNVGLFDPEGNPAPYFQFRTPKGMVISFQPSKRFRLEKLIGDYFFAFQMGEKGIPGRQYAVTMRLEQSDRPFRPEKMR